MHSEAKLLDHVRAQVTDEEVLAAGWFEPLDRALLQSTSAGLAMMSGVGTAPFEEPTLAATVPNPAALDAAEEAADEALANLAEAPAAAILAVTPTKLYAFNANPVLATTAVKELWKVWDRAAIEVHGSKILLALVISIRDVESGQVIQWEASKTHLAGPKHVLAELLTGG